MIAWGWGCMSERIGSLSWLREASLLPLWCRGASCVRGCPSCWSWSWSWRRLVCLSSIIFISGQFVSVGLTIAAYCITGINLGFSFPPLITWKWGRKRRRRGSIFSFLIQLVQTPLLFLLF